MQSSKVVLGCASDFAVVDRLANVHVYGHYSMGQEVQASFKSDHVYIYVYIYKTSMGGEHSCCMSSA